MAANPIIRNDESGLALIVVPLTLVMVCVGCGRDPRTFQVSGKVTLEGQPLHAEGGRINFLKAGERPRGGGIQADGNFSFQLPSGKYTVTVVIPAKLSEPEGYLEQIPVGPPPIPERYANPTTSDLTLEVSDLDLEDVVFNLTKAAQKRL